MYIFVLYTKYNFQNNQTIFKLFTQLKSIHIIRQY